MVDMMTVAGIRKQANSDDWWDRVLEFLKVCHRTQKHKTSSSV